MSEHEEPPNGLPVHDLKQHYEVYHKIGTGSFGDVLAAFVVQKPESFSADTSCPVLVSRPIQGHRAANNSRSVAEIRQVVALKMLRNTHERQIHFRLREVTFYRKVPSHRNLVKLHDMFQDSQTKNVVFSLEHMHGALYDLVKNHKFAAPGRGMTPLKIASIMRDIANGLWHIHTHGFVHRDLKPENILFSQTHSGNLIVKLADFGLSRPLDVWGQISSPWTSYVATRWYRAPEQLLAMPDHTEALDMFAFGGILYEVCNMVPMAPGGTTNEMIERLVKQLGMPAKNSLGGRCQAMEAIIKEKFPGLAEQMSGRGLLMMRFRGHEMFFPALRGVLQWDPSNRDDAQWTVARFSGLVDRLSHQKRLFVPHRSF